MQFTIYNIFNIQHGLNAPINVKPQGGGDGLPTGILTFWGEICQILLH